MALLVDRSSHFKFFFVFHFYGFGIYNDGSKLIFGFSDHDYDICCVYADNDFIFFNAEVRLRVKLVVDVAEMMVDIFIKVSVFRIMGYRALLHSLGFYYQ